MSADINVLCIEESFRHRCIYNAGSGREHTLQGLCPCIQRLVHGDSRTAVFQHSAVRHLTDYRVRDGQFAHLSIRNFADNIAPACCKEVSRIHIVLDLNAQLIAERHLCHGFSQSMTFHRISGNDSASRNLVIKLLIPIHELLIDR